MDRLTSGVYSILFYGSTLATAGCGGTLTLAKRTFERTYACSEPVEVLESSGRVEATGCGRTAHYVCERRTKGEGPLVEERVCGEEHSWQKVGPELEVDDLAIETWLAGAEGSRLALSGVPEYEPATVSLHVELVVANAPENCPLAVMADGAKLGTWSAERVDGTIPSRYRARIPLQAATALAHSTVATGTLCEDRWMVSASYMDALREFADVYTSRAPAKAAANGESMAWSQPEKGADETGLVEESAPSAAPVSAPTLGCEHDMQCKADRVCVAGTCTSPRESNPAGESAEARAPASALRDTASGRSGSGNRRP